MKRLPLPLRLPLLLLLVLLVVGAGTAARQVGSPTFSPLEHEHVLSVSAYIYALAQNATASILYTIDGTAPVRNGPSTFILSSGSAVFLDKIGETTFRAIGMAQNYTDSFEAVKKYSILNRCAQPVILPNGGTFAGSVQITLGAQLTGGEDVVKIFYSMDGSMPAVGSSLSVDSGTTITLDAVGTTTIKCIAYKVGFAPSSIAEATFTLLPKVAPVVITPESNAFTISATLQFSCSTPKAAIFYTLADGDGDAETPSFKSLTVKNSGTITIEQAGRHVVKAIAMESSMLPSDVITKVIHILDRASKPRLRPAPGVPYVNDVTVSFQCTDASSSVDDSSEQDWSWKGGVVYYTIGETATPTLESPHIECGGHLLLKAPGHYIIRAFVRMDSMSNSAILQSEYVLTRAAFDTFPMNSNKQFSVLPVVNVKPVQTSSGAQGRLLTLSNPIGHLDLLLPPNGKDFGTVTEVGASYSPLQVDLADAEFLGYADRVAFEAAMEASEDVWSAWDKEYADAAYSGCLAASSSGIFNDSTGLTTGSIVVGGNVIQAVPDGQRSVHFGTRNGSFVLGYIAAEEVSDPVNPFDALFAGAGWLVREGKSYIQENLASTGDAEDLSAWPANFVSSKLARTAVGFDSMGRFLLLQVDGASAAELSSSSSSSTPRQEGLSLYDLSELAVELGFASAINVQAGALTQNSALLSFPPKTCSDANTRSIFHCEEKVGTVLCIHSWSPLVRPIPIDPSPSPAPTKEPIPPAAAAQPQQQPLPYPASSSAEPTLFPTPSWMSPIYSIDYGSPTLAPTDYNLVNLTSSSPMAALQHSLLLYKQSSYFLSVLLMISLAIHACACMRSRKRELEDNLGAGGASERDVSGGVGFSMPHRIQAIPGPANNHESRKKRGTHSGKGPPEPQESERSVYNLNTALAPPRRNQSTHPRDWQAKLGSLNLAVDSDTEDEDGVEVVDFYRRDLPQMRGSTPQANKRSASAAGKWSKSPAVAANSSLSYAQVGVDSDEDDGDSAVNPFHRAATRA